MARTRHDGDGSGQELGPPIVKGESTSVSGGVSPSELPVITDVIRPSKVIGEAFDDPKPGDPVAKRYFVLRDHNVSTDGFRTLMREGTVITDSCFDIDALRKQGVKFRAATDED